MEFTAPYIYHSTRQDGVLPHEYLGGTMVHLLVTAGSMRFYFAGELVEATRGCLVIWQMRSNIQQVQYSDDFDAEYFVISRSFMLQFKPEVKWASLGFLYIKMHPVFPLQTEEWEVMLQDFLEMGKRMRTEHLFQQNLVRHVLQVFMLDMWNIYSREIHKLSFNTTANQHFSKFLELVQQHCVTQRSVAFYSEKLCISSAYLLQICQQVSNRSASDWIQYYTVQEVVTRLNNLEISLSQISEELQFSSLAYFSTYVKKHLGVSPSEFRK